MLAMTVGNLTMIDAYKAGFPGNGKPVPDGAKMAKVHWIPKPNQFFPEATVPGELLHVDFMVNATSDSQTAVDGDRPCSSTRPPPIRSNPALKRACRRRGTTLKVTRVTARRRVEITSSPTMAKISEFRRADNSGLI